MPTISTILGRGCVLRASVRGIKQCQRLRKQRYCRRLSGNTQCANVNSRKHVNTCIFHEREPEYRLQAKNRLAGMLMW